MSSISGIQQVLSNITGVEKVQLVQQQQAQAELARHTSEGQKSAENTGKKVEDREPVDKVASASGIFSIAFRCSLNAVADSDPANSRASSV